jgi:alpha-tubulin suppressor-like RCC1 family protein
LTTEDGEIYGFGENNDGQLALPKQAKIEIPTFLMKNENFSIILSRSSLNTDWNIQTHSHFPMRFKERIDFLMKCLKCFQKKNKFENSKICCL